MKAMCIQAINHRSALCREEKVPCARIIEWQCLAGGRHDTDKGDIPAQRDFVWMWRTLGLSEFQETYPLPYAQGLNERLLELMHLMLWLIQCNFGLYHSYYYFIIVFIVLYALYLFVLYI